MNSWATPAPETSVGINSTKARAFSVLVLSYLGTRLDMGRSLVQISENDSQFYKSIFSCKKAVMMKPL